MKLSKTYHCRKPLYSKLSLAKRKISRIREADYSLMGYVPGSKASILTKFPDKKAKKIGIRLFSHLTKARAESKTKGLELDESRKRPFHLIRYDELVLFKRDLYDPRHYVEALDLANRSFNYRGSLSELEQLLPINFLRIERGLIVNVDMIDRIVNSKTIEINEQRYVVGASYSERFKEFLSRYFD